MQKDFAGDRTGCHKEPMPPTAQGPRGCPPPSVTHMPSSAPGGRLAPGGTGAEMKSRGQNPELGPLGCAVRVPAPGQSPHRCLNTRAGEWIAPDSRESPEGKALSAASHLQQGLGGKRAVTSPGVGVRRRLVRSRVCGKVASAFCTEVPALLGADGCSLRETWPAWNEDGGTQEGRPSSLTVTLLSISRRKL